MDPRFFSRKGYDTDLLILRSLFALNPVTNMPISTNYLLTTDGIGGLVWEDSAGYFSSVLGFPNLASTIAFLSTGLSTNTQNISTIFTNLTNNSLSTNTISTGFVATSTLGLIDIINGTSQILTASNGGLFLNGNAVVPGSGVTLPNLVSTVGGLGTAGYISSSRLGSALASTVNGLGTVGYVSTSYLVDYVNNNNIGLGSLGYISSSQLISTTESLLAYVSVFPSGAQIISSATVYGTANFPSTASIGVLNYFTQDVSTLSTAVGTSLENNYYGWVTSSQLFSTVSGLGGSGLISTGQLFSSIEGLGTLGYLSSSQLISTVAGLGTAGYISSQQLLSTSLGITASISTFVYKDSAPLFLGSTITGLGTAGYISSSQLQSTIETLGSLGFVSTSFLNNSLTSTTIGLDKLGYLNVTALNNGLTSTVQGLGTSGYISSTQLQSSIIGLGGTGLVSTGQLASSIAGLGTAGYISSSQLFSTSVGLQRSFYVANTNTVNVINSQVIISSVSNIIYLSSILQSSITYQGINSQIQASNNIPAAQPLYFSSALLPIDLFSSYITPRSYLTIEANPTFLFSPLGLPSGGGVRIFMSTFLQSGTNYLSTFQATNMFYPTNTSDSNFFNPSVKISLPANAISNYFGTGNPIYLSHYLPNAATLGLTQGFVNCNVTVFYGSTNSVFLSIQNLP